MNCRGLNGKQKRRDVMDYLRNKNASIICLQDVHFTDNMESIVKAEWGGEGVFSFFASNSRGVVIFISNKLDYTIHKTQTDNCGNWVALDISLNGTRITLISVYGPNEDKPIFYEKIRRLVDDFNNAHCILCGDWNVIQDPVLDTSNYIHVNNPKARNVMLEMKHQCGLIDPWRLQNPKLRRFTWRQKTPLKQSRLDYFLLSDELTTYLISSEIEPGYRTDHSLITLVLDLAKIKRGKGFWKFNNSLLKDSDFSARIKNKISEVKKQYAVPLYNFENIDQISHSDVELTINDQLFLEVLLMEIRGEIIRFAAEKQKRTKRNELLLEKDIKELEDEFLTNTKTDILEKIDSKKLQLEEIRLARMEGVMLRSKARWVEDGEKPTKYFINLEKRNIVNKTISHLQNSNGHDIRNQTQIMEETLNFYEKLYECKDNDLNLDEFDQNLSSSDFPSLTENQLLYLEGKLNKNELVLALKNMSNNKSPGSDGFTVEFWKFFFNDLGDFLLRSINYAYESGQLSVTQRLGIITLLPKGNKPKQYLKNWRPISLLNITYKLASSCIANRLKSVLPTIIDDDQKGFMKGRYIGENTRLLYDLILYTQLHNQPGMLLLIDFEKAFDSVSHKFIFKVLDFLSFGPSFKKWIKLFYNESVSSVMVNGNASKQFQLGRGCRQGDPLSPYIFLLCAEVLGCLIRKNKGISGIVVGNIECKITQYADDSTIILDGSDESLRQTLKVIDLFKRLSGLKINEEKTNVVYIGSLRNRKPNPGIINKHLNWVKDGKFSALGIQFSTELSEMCDINYNVVIESVTNLIHYWSKRNLTVLGRITVVKSLLIPKFNHLILSIPNPRTDFLKTLQTKIYKFIWNNKNGKICRNQLSNDFADGGLRLVKVDLFFEALKCTWIRRIVSGNVDEKGLNLFKQFTGIDINDLEKGSMFTYNVAKTVRNIFWKEVLLAWYKVKKQHIPITCDDVLKSSLWNNEYFKIGGKEFNYKRWTNRGIHFVTDLIHPNENRFLLLQEIREKYGLISNFLEYNSVLQAVKSPFKQQFHDNASIVPIPRPFIPFHLSCILKDKKGCKSLYKYFSSPKVPKSKQYWERKLNLTFSDNEWKMNCLIPFKCTMDVKFRWFQYRITNRILTTNTFMYKIGQRGDDRCTFCDEEPETIEHLLVDCKKVKPIWSKFQNWCYEKLHIPIVLQKREILFGTDLKKENLALNLFIILIKFYIYRKRCQISFPFFTPLQKEMKNYCQLEKYILLKNLNFSLYQSKWQVWRCLFE